MYKESEFKQAIRLPSPKTLKSKTTKGSGPWEKLQEWFIKKYGKEEAKHLFQNLWVRPDYYNEVDALVIDRVMQTFPTITPLAVEAIVGWYDLEFAPASFTDVPTFTKKGFGYIRAKKSDTRSQNRRTKVRKA